MNKNYLLAFAAAALFSTGLQAQTADAVFTIFNNKCTGCHAGGSPSGGWAVGANVNAFYTNTVNVTPTTPGASGRGDKLIVPNDTAASFLFRKVHPTMPLDPNDGTKMPQGASPLTSGEIATISNWIKAGAPASTVGIEVADKTTAKVWAPIGQKQLHIELPAAAGMKVEVYSLTSGQLVYETQLKEARQIINLENVSAGIYIYRLTGANGAVQTGKVVF